MAILAGSNCQTVFEGNNVKLLELIEPLHGLSNEIDILTCHRDGVSNPIDACRDTAIASNVFCQVYAVCEQKHATELQIWI